MFRFLIFRLWPAWIPILLYVGWFLWRTRKHAKEGLEKPKITDGPWRMTLLAAMLLAAGSLLLWGLMEPAQQGGYTPAHMENGKLIRGQVDDKN